MTIRRAENKDIPGINDLLIQVCNVHAKERPDLFKFNARKYTSEQLEVILADDETPVFVAVSDEDEVLGYVFCIFEQNIGNNALTDIKSLYIDDLCVDEKLRGGHIGKRLYEYTVDFAKKNGCYNLTLNVWNCNPTAMKFYESCGLVPQKVHMEAILTS